MRRTDLHPAVYYLFLLLMLGASALATGNPNSLASARGSFESADTLSSLSQADSQFLSVEQAYQLQIAILDGRPLLRWTIADGYYLYRHQFDFQLLPDIHVEGTRGEQATDAQARQPEWQHQAELPDGIIKDDPYFGRVETYYRELSIRLAELPGPGVLAVTSQGCADGGLCYPPQTVYYRLDPATGSVALTSPPAESGGPGGSGFAAAGSSGLLVMALFAALGGMVLNLMPCVFPVLSLKVMSFAEDRSHSLTRHGISYTLGVVSSFIAIAVAMLALTSAGRAVGWGFQLQSPLFIALLACLFLTLGLSLSGFWTLGSRWMGLGQGLTMRRGYAGSFFTGVLAVVVASPCTAPFMGTALGFASTQPALPALTVFAALGFGMALPILLLCLFPGWLRRLPKPGPWMERFKQLLAYPLYATAIWLTWVLGRQAGVDAMAALLGGALLLALALWLWRFGLIARSVAAAALAVVLAILTGPLLHPSATTPSAGDGIEPYSAARLAELRAAGRPVFVNVTADWCLTCLANERVALSSPTVRNAFAAAGVTYLKADWTRYDPAITDFLAEHGRNGVPLYLYFAPGADAELLPQLLTAQRVVDVLGPTMPISAEIRAE